METRKVQKTNDMCYLYLPTKWCKARDITNGSILTINNSSDGSLVLSTAQKQEKNIHLTLKVDGKNINALHKLVIASYISPASSFRIILENPLDFTKILSHKNLVSLELVEIDENEINCESTLQINDPLQLLITMIRKVKNLLLLRGKSAPTELIERYEEEIDRNKLLIEKSVIKGLSMPSVQQHPPLMLHFISLLSKELEHIADHLIQVKKPNEKLTAQINTVLQSLYSLSKDSFKNVDYFTVEKIIKDLDVLEELATKNKLDYKLFRVVRSLNSISEVLMDWAMVKQVQNKVG